MMMKFKAGDKVRVEYPMFDSSNKLDSSLTYVVRYSHGTEISLEEVEGRYDEMLFRLVSLDEFINKLTELSHEYGMFIDGCVINNAGIVLARELEYDDEYLYKEI